MHDKSQRLLIYSNDPLLAETRRLILKNGGYLADTVASEQSFSDGLGQPPSDYRLAILCYTLTDDARATAHEIANRAGVPIWQLQSLISAPTFVAEVSKHLSQV